MIRAGRIFIFILITVFCVGSYTFYANVFAPNVKENTFLYIPSGANFKNVADSLEKNKSLKNADAFFKAASWLKYKNTFVKPGRYKIFKDMNNKELITLLRSGKQTPVRLTFNNIRKKEAFCAYIASKLEVDSAALIKLLENDEYLANYGFTKETVFTIFIPNTYNILWNTNAEKFFKRMHSEYNKFWTSERTEKASQTNLTPIQATILASIVYAETKNVNEMPLIAGVYLNRIKRGMKLDSDPTVVYSIGDFTIKRVSSKMLTHQSPYNTYINGGLPPGPICMPSVEAINAVLNYKRHDYLYFCASIYSPGLHVFAKTFKDHLKNARSYRRALNNKGIKINPL